MLSLFAVSSANRFVHISEVERGLSCDCRCAVCNETVLARQGDVREHHFAHVSNADPCNSSHESDLHRFAKRVIVEAGGLVVPVTTSVSQALGFCEEIGPTVLMECSSIEEEVAVDDRRPDLLAATSSGTLVAIEIAYSSFCDESKAEAYEARQLPALEVDLSAFTPSGFDICAVKRAILSDVTSKSWIWPVGMQITQNVHASPDSPQSTTEQPIRRLPEEIVTIRGRWISVKELPSGDIAIKAVRYDPDIVSVVKTVARSHSGHYQPSFHSWVIPRFLSRQARAHLTTLALRANSGDRSIEST